MTREDIEELFERAPVEQKAEATRYIVPGYDGVIEIYFDDTGGEWSPENKPQLPYIPYPKGTPLR